LTGPLGPAKHTCRCHGTRITALDMIVPALREAVAELARHEGEFAGGMLGRAAGAEPGR